jgi:hypothetical protein
MGGKSHGEKIKKFLGLHSQGRKKFAAEKALLRAEKKQEKEIRSGRKGHKPKPREILKK